MKKYFVGIFAVAISLLGNKAFSQAAPGQAICIELDADCGSGISVNYLNFNPICSQNGSSWSPTGCSGLGNQIDNCSPGMSEMTVGWVSWHATPSNTASGKFKVSTTSSSMIELGNGAGVDKQVKISFFMGSNANPGSVSTSATLTIPAGGFLDYPLPYKTVSYDGVTWANNAIDAKITITDVTP